MTTAQYPTTGAVTALRTHMGVDADSVRIDTTAHDGWAAISNGILVSVHIRRWRGETQLSLDDLGLSSVENPEFLEALREQTVLGRKLLLPKKLLDELKRREQRGRALVERYTFNIRQGSYLPFTVYEDWKRDNDLEKAGYMAMADQIVEDYPVIKTQVLEMYRRMAGDNYDLLLARGTVPDLARLEFVEAYVAKISSLIPPADTIRASFSWEEDLDYIPMPSTVEADLQLREQIQQRRQVDAEESRQMAAMNRDLAQHARRQKQEQIDGMLGHIRRQMLERIYETTSEMTSKLNENPAITGAQVHSLKTLIAQVQQMNFMGDGEVDQKIGALENLLTSRGNANGNGSGASVQNVLSGLSQLNQDIRGQATELLSRRSVRSQMRLDASGQDMVFGRRVSRLRKDLADASVPAEFVPQQEITRVRRDVRAA